MPECDAIHTVGKIVLKSNRATQIGGIDNESRVDCFTGSRSFEYGAEYPKSSGNSYLRYSVLYVGGIIDNDTIVSGFNFTPLLSKKYRSIINPDSPDFIDAVSEQDYISIEADNIYDPIYNPLNLKSLNIEVKKSSYAWSYEYAEDFVLFDVEIKNIGEYTIRKSYIALSPEVAAGNINNSEVFLIDDIRGFYISNQQESDCSKNLDNLFISWGADNDGDPVEGEFVDYFAVTNSGFKKSAPDIAGLLFLENFTKTHQKIVKTSYNWWAYDFAPREKKNVHSQSFYDLFGDRSFGFLYNLFSNGEIDYDQIKMASITQSDAVWRYPEQQIAGDVSDGYPNIGTALSVGPFDIPPGGVLKIPFAFIAGEDFHKDPNNGSNLPNFPNQFYENVDFSDIANNAMWARWIYDNPGVDTDGDGDSGRSIICNNDTIWIEGDGIPDWKAAGPPPAPYIWLEPSVNGVRVRFNGSRSETEKDIFTQIADFEGYNIYLGRDERETSLSLVASYDNDNYDKFVFLDYVDEPTFKVEDIPYSLDELRCLYADSCNDVLFNPLSYTRSFPLSINDSLFYFTEHNYNPGYSTITKVYPTARDPRTVPADSLNADDYTDEGYFKFFEYEYVIDNLLPTIDYWVNVTSFDFGSPKSGLKALESSKTIGIQKMYPLSSDEDNPDSYQQIYVYPNPYRLDADYRGQGFEGRTEDDRPDYRVRALNFANLPPMCEIKIYSLDGDLIRHLSHNIPRSDPTYRHDSWDLITRNTQMVVSGLYYWTVEFPDGEVQMGKIVVVM